MTRSAVCGSVVESITGIDSTNPTADDGLRPLVASRQLRRRQLTKIVTAGPIMSAVSSLLGQSKRRSESGFRSVLGAAAGLCGMFFRVTQSPFRIGCGVRMNAVDRSENAIRIRFAVRVALAIFFAERCCRTRLPDHKPVFDPKMGRNGQKNCLFAQKTLPKISPKKKTCIYSAP